jgi:hypothetical protein
MDKRAYIQPFYYYTISFTTPRKILKNSSTIEKSIFPIFCMHILNCKSNHWKSEELSAALQEFGLGVN